MRWSVRRSHRAAVGTSPRWCFVHPTRRRSLNYQSPCVCLLAPIEKLALTTAVLLSRWMALSRC